MRLRKDVVVNYDQRQSRPWLVRWWGKYDPSSERQPRFSKGFELKKIAEKFAQTLKDDIQDGFSVEPKNITLESLKKKFDETVKGTVAPITLRTYNGTLKLLNNYFGSQRNIKTIKKDEAIAFINDIALERNDSTPSDSTKHRHLRNAKRIFNVAKDFDYIRKNPFSKIPLGHIEKEDWHLITPQEFNALIKAVDALKLRKNIEAKDLKNKLLCKAFYSVMYGCGLRFGEAINLIWTNENIDFQNNAINLVNRTAKAGLPPFTLKNYEKRSIPAPKWVMDSLLELKKYCSSKNPYVFLTDARYDVISKKWLDWKDKNKTDNWVSGTMANNTNRKFRLYFKKAGLVTHERLSVHCLRKGYGTNLANMGTPVHTLKELMGHSKIETTMEYYVKSSDANKKAAVEGLEKLVG